MARKPGKSYKIKENKNGSKSIYEKKNGSWKKTGGVSSLKPRKKK